MGDYLNSSATLICPHGGTVSAMPANSSITVGGSLIVLDSDTFMIAACPFMIGSSPHPCIQVAWQVSAKKGSAAGSSALTTESVGLCKAADGAVQGSVNIQMTQTQGGGL